MSTTGAVYAWGYDHYGQLGNGTTTDQKTPVAVSMPGGVSATAVSAGLYFSLALGNNGHVYGWGYNTDGEIGNGTTTNSATPVQSNLPGGVTPSAISTGLYNGLALASNGTLYGWGQNGFGQLGNGTTTNETSPVSVTFPTNATFSSLASDSSSSHSLAVATPTKSTTTSELDRNVTSPVYGQTVDLVGVTSGSDGGGTVAIQVDGVTIPGCGAIRLAAVGSVYWSVCPIATIPAGVHTVDDVYSGDAASLGSTSPTVSMTVTQAPLLVTASSGAATYGGAPPTITPSYAGFVNGDTASVLTTVPHCSTTATSSSSAGNYTSSCSGGSAANYSLSYANGVVVVGTAPLSIAASSGTMTYGGTVPTVSPSYSGFVNGDQASSLSTPPSCSTTATSASPVATYPSSCSGAVDPNYSISYTNGNVVVGAAPLVISASSAATTYGTTAAAITPSYKGFLNGDTASSLTTAPSCSTTATAASGIGTYGSSCTGASDPNYSISYVNGTVTVSPAPITVTASSGSMTYGGTVPQTDAQVNGLQNGEDVSVLGASLACSTAATSSSSVGTYSASCSAGPTRTTPSPMSRERLPSTRLRSP